MATTIRCFLVSVALSGLVTAMASVFAQDTGHMHNQHGTAADSKTVALSLQQTCRLVQSNPVRARIMGCPADTNLDIALPFEEMSRYVLETLGFNVVRGRPQVCSGSLIIEAEVKVFGTMCEGRYPYCCYPKAQIRGSVSFSLGKQGSSTVEFQNSYEPVTFRDGMFRSPDESPLGVAFWEERDGPNRRHYSFPRAVIEAIANLVGAEKTVELLKIDAEDPTRNRAQRSLIDKLRRDLRYRTYVNERDLDKYIRDAAQDILLSMGGKAVDPLISALKDEENDVRLRAAQVLGRIGSPRSVEPLILTVRDSGCSGSTDAGVALIWIGEPALDFLIPWLQDPDSCFREKILRVIRNISEDTGDSRALEQIIQALADACHKVRIEAAWALEFIGDARAVEPLVAALKDKSPSVRRHAATALGKIGDKRALKPLVNVSKRDAKKYVREAALEAINEILDRSPTWKM